MANEAEQNQPRTPMAARPAPVHRINSQAGLTAHGGGEARSLPSVPSPGQPGSRFNPKVRENPNRTVGEVTKRTLPSAAMIDTRTIPGREPQPLDVAQGAAAEVAPEDGVAKAASKGFMGGFIGGLGAGVQRRADALTRESEELEQVEGGDGAWEGDRSVYEATSVAQRAEPAVSRGDPRAVHRGVELPESRFTHEAQLARAAARAAEVEGSGTKANGAKDLSHLDEFPELKGIKTPTGVAAQFPELAEDHDTDAGGRGVQATSGPSFG